MGTEWLEKTLPAEPANIPGSAELLASFDTSERSEIILTNIAQQLRRHHEAQWQAEDSSRKSADDDQLLAAIKRQIDDLNMTRSRLVDEIDAWAAEHIDQNSDGALHTETLGSVIDRICIAWVRADRLREVPNAESRAHLADRQLRQLSEAYDQLLGELVRGWRRVPVWKTMKSYGESG